MCQESLLTDVNIVNIGYSGNVKSLRTECVEHIAYSGITGSRRLNGAINKVEVLNEDKRMKKELSWIKWDLILGISIIIQGGIVGYVFNNPYPCTISGVGCHSPWEMICDTWSSIYAFGSAILGFWFLSQMIVNFHN